MNIDTLRSVELVNRKQFYVRSAARATGSRSIPMTVRRSAMRSTATARNPSHLSRPESEFSRRSSRARKCSAGISAIGTEFADEPVSKRRPAAHGRGHSGFASFAARPRRAAHAALRAGRQEVALAALATAPPSAIAPDAALVTVAALRCARVGILRRPPDSVERAALSMLPESIGTPFPSGRGRKIAKELRVEPYFRGDRFLLRYNASAC